MFHPKDLNFYQKDVLSYIIDEIPSVVNMRTHFQKYLKRVHFPVKI